MRLQIRYNSPVILTFSLLAILILLLDDAIWPRLTVHYFAVGGSINWLNVLDGFRLFSHILGHANWQHLVGNLSLILLLGPILEEKYGSRLMLLMVLITAFATGIINILLFSTGLMGASGIVFMLIVLASIVDIRSREIPLTFLLVASIYLGREVILAFQDDNVSQIAHLVGGIIGALLGFNAKCGALAG